MKRSITREKLWIIENDVIRIQREFPSLAFFFDKEFTSFFKRPGNEGKLNILHRGVHNIQKKYIVHDDKNMPQRIGGDGPNANDWKYKDSVVATNGQLLTGEMIEAAYIAELNEFLQEKIFVEI